MKKGGRNLFFLGVGSIVIALITTAVSLFIYHHSGDIYLDRSRPGFLPDEEEVAAEELYANDDYHLSDSGAIDRETLDEYLEELQKAINEATSVKNPYSSSPLSDDSLGISAKNLTEP